jgi:AAA domain/UvrD-like helicase C-terminal domain
MAFLIPENLRSRADVPSAVRRVAVALKNGLDDDVIVWFEPLFDNTGSKPHFVVLMPDNGIAVVEVLEVRPNKLLGSVRGRLRIVRDNEEAEVEQPLARADSFAATLHERIAAEPRLGEVQVAVAAAAVFPLLERADTDERNLETVLDLDRCIFRSEVEQGVAGETPSSLHRRFVQLLGASSPIEGPLLDIVRGLVQPEIVIDSPDDGQLAIFRPPEGEDLVRVMDQQQEALAKSIGEGHRVVRGVAGSGKTLILVYRAKLFAQMFPQHRFLLTCYTRSLAGVLRTNLEDYPNIDVEHLGTLIWRAIRDSGLSDPKFRDESGEERAAVALEALKRGALGRYRAVFVDEAQDFGPNALRFAVSLADDRFNDVLIVADAAQNVFRQRFSWKDAGIQAQGRTKILRRNYRNTREILELAHAFLLPEGTEADVLDLDDEAVIVPPDAAVRQGPAPTLIYCDRAALVESAVEEAKRYTATRSAPKTLALLTIGNRQAIDLERRLRSERIPFFFVTDPQKDENKDKVAEALEPVILSTVYSAKGLEFPSVVLCCTPRENQTLDELRSTIYVGMTRATERLTVLAEPDHPLAAELRIAAEERGRIRVDAS